MIFLYKSLSDTAICSRSATQPVCVAKGALISFLHKPAGRKSVLCGPCPGRIY
ncbi:unnamed protein product [Ectocarpus sp. CCAP 1310/34]|nr:unnamed protein product [Ectocarpus sp. CCAP 1310/34]